MKMTLPITFLPEGLREDEISSTVFTIRNKIFNCKGTVNNINTNDTSTYRTALGSCICANSKYFNHHHGHIITGGLQIIENKNFVRLRVKVLIIGN